MAPTPKSSHVPHTVHEYTILPLTIPATPSLPKPTKHYLYLRPNAPKITNEDTPREIFIVNIPIDATESHVRHLFNEQLSGARVEKVEFEGARTGRKITAPVAPKTGSRKRKRGGEGEGGEVFLPVTWDREVRGSGSTGVVTFVDAVSAEMAIKEARRAGKTGREVVWGEGVDQKVPALGSARYLTHHKLRYPAAAVLQANVDAYMVHFADQEAARAKLLARQRAVPDEDGFVTVVRGGRAGPARQEEAQEKAEKQKEKSVGKEDFYRFQMREKRKERAGELLKGFEEDRRKVDEMRKRRNKFKPN